MFHARIVPASLTTAHVCATALTLGWALLLTAGCTERGTPVAPSALTEAPSAPLAQTASAAAHVANHGEAAADNGLIDGWFDGEEVALYYTKSFFCEEPPQSGAESECVIGADAEVDPRPGPIRTIYALAAVGFQPDPATLACPAGSVCLNHPAMIDASRVGGSPTANAVPHSHILTERGGGWRKTVNIRVFNLDAWNQIAAAKSLAKVRELQGDPTTGRPGVISADTPTNIFFFIASWRD
jgi:hypothetical protein